VTFESEEAKMEEQKKVPREDEMYCPSCGSIIKKEAEICVHCGVRVRRASASKPKEKCPGKPIAGGILGIIASVAPLIAAIVLISAGATPDYEGEPLDWVQIGAGIALLALALVTMVGSSYAILRRNFGLAIAGGICAVFSMGLLGVPALILIALSGKEFKRIG
jgi:hypothetical protein